MFCQIFAIFDGEHRKCCRTLKSHQTWQKFANKWRKALFDMPYTYFLADFGCPFHSGRENLKKSMPKNNCEVKYINFTIFFLAKFNFLLFQNWPKINFSTGKKFKTAKNAIWRNKILIYLISRVFFYLDFFKFSGPPLWTLKGPKRFLKQWTR